MKQNTAFTLVVLMGLLLGACQPKPAETAPAAPLPSDVAESPQPQAASPTPNLSTSETSAALSEISGKVAMKSPGAAAFQKADESMRLEVNGQIETGADGKVRLDLSSGTILRVGPSSLFTLTENKDADGGLASKIDLIVGKIFVILNGGSVEVNTPTGVAAVQGSYLKVELDPVSGDVTLTCLEGDCSASNPAGAVNFTNGQKVVLFHQDPTTGKWSVPNVEPMSPEDFQEWLDENPEAKAIYDQLFGNGSVNPAPPACSSIISPASGAELPFQGKVHFEWTPQPGAAKYLVKFINPNGVPIIFETDNVYLDQYIEGFLPGEGSSSWSVTPLDESGAEICASASSSFSKPNSKWPTPVKEKEQPPANTCGYYYCY
ncbi:MAG: hypothetical protein Fur002_18770 [Anaerolineales bacterium]